MTRATIHAIITVHMAAVGCMRLRMGDDHRQRHRIKLRVDVRSSSAIEARNVFMHIGHDDSNSPIGVEQ